MKKYRVTYDHSVYKPSNYELYKKQCAWSAEVEADNLADAKFEFRVQFEKNPIYFNFTEL